MVLGTVDSFVLRKLCQLASKFPFFTTDVFENEIYFSFRDIEFIFILGNTLKKFSLSKPVFVVPPSKPTSLLALPLSATSVLVSWQPGFDGHSPLTGYKMSWSTGSLPVMAVDGITETTYTVTSLEPYSVYNFSVRSQNAIGYGEAANVYNRTLEAGRLSRSRLSIFNFSLYHLLGYCINYIVSL